MIYIVEDSVYIAFLKDLTLGTKDACYFGNRPKFELVHPALQRGYYYSRVADNQILKIHLFVRNTLFLAWLAKHSSAPYSERDRAKNCVFKTEQGREAILNFVNSVEVKSLHARVVDELNLLKKTARPELRLIKKQTSWFIDQMTRLAKKHNIDYIQITNAILKELDSYDATGLRKE